ncbi:MAG: 23S rRNA (adenine(2503)-C(2))-methyltransferase RlmN [Ardenticatenia bacterium]|nr:23S rRNA (adenine(2503)-C(2))-methyltransferase RlmN [Ardenticatenia bacterium]
MVPAAPDSRSSLYGFSLPQLVVLLADLGQPAWRARQIWRWLYVGLVDDFAEMTDLPAGLRAALAERFRLHTVTVETATDSHDSPATKFLFRLRDGKYIETVLMHYGDEAAEAPDDDEAVDALVPDDSAGEPTGLNPVSVPQTERHTVCLSTQAGCAMGCVFCATGQMGLLRDLDQGECVEQVVWCARSLAGRGKRLTHVVFMGMGEPLANWPATWGTVETLTDPSGLQLSARRLTLSTVGIVPGIDRLAAMGKPVRLAVSLHAPDDRLRSRLVAVNQVYPLQAILDACHRYQDAGGRRITFEYVLIEGINDRVAQAKALARQLRGLRAHVNLIPLNPTAGSPLRPSPPARALAFRDALQHAGLSTTLRLRRGIDIQAGCGQLRMRVEGPMGRTIPLELTS